MGLKRKINNFRAKRLEKKAVRVEAKGQKLTKLFNEGAVGIKANQKTHVREARKATSAIGKAWHGRLANSNAKAAKEFKTGVKQVQAKYGARASALRAKAAKLRG